VKGANDEKVAGGDAAGLSGSGGLLALHAVHSHRQRGGVRYVSVLEV